MAKLTNRAVMAAEQFLLRRNYNVLDAEPAGNQFDLVAVDEDDVLVFVDVTYRTGSLPAEPEVTPAKRTRIENAIATWLAEHDDAIDKAVRFDTIALNVLGENKAFLRHHINALGVG